MDSSFARSFGKAIELAFWLAVVALPISLILNVVLIILLWSK